MIQRSTNSQEAEPRPGETATRLLPPVLVDTAAAFADFLDAVSHEGRLALDTESDSLYRYFYRVCLIQVSTVSTDYLLDPVRLPDLQPLGRIMADPAVEKVFHAAENDIVLLKRDFAFDFNHIFDTMIAARILGRRYVGLAALLQEYFGVELDKRVQLTDWGRRPLTTEQLSYARMDSRYLLSLANLLADDLRSEHRWREAQEAFAELPGLVYVEKPFDPEGFWRAKGVRELSPAEIAVFRELYLWRDKQARAMNLPAFKVLTDQMLHHLSQEQPQRIEALRLNPRQASRFGPALLEAIARGRTAPPPSPPRRSNGEGRPDPEVVARYDRLRAWRARRASERGVEPDIVLNNETLLAIARAQPEDVDALASLRVMGPFKLGEYGADIVRVIVDSSR